MYLPTEGFQMKSNFSCQPGKDTIQLNQEKVLKREEDEKNVLELLNNKQ